MLASRTNNNDKDDDKNDDSAPSAYTKCLSMTNHRIRRRRFLRNDLSRRRRFLKIKEQPQRDDKPPTSQTSTDSRLHTATDNITPQPTISTTHRKRQYQPHTATDSQPLTCFYVCVSLKCLLFGTHIHTHTHTYLQVFTL